MLWRNRFGREYMPLVREITEWINEWMNITANRYFLSNHFSWILISETLTYFMSLFVTTSDIFTLKQRLSFWVNSFSRPYKNKQNFLIWLDDILEIKHSILTTKPQTLPVQVYRDSVLSVLIYNRNLVNE
jgi:hypothetical protein